MADHNIEINVNLHDADVLRQLREIGSQLDRMSNMRNISIRPTIDMSGVQRLITGLNQAASITGTISNAFQGLANFSSSIGNAFSGMSGLFKSDFLSSMERYLAGMATRVISGSVDDVIRRYDILSTFTPYMQIAGVSSTAANSALNRVNESILGLPIGLDEAAYRLRRYQMFVGDTERATNLTIGLQNAMTAGGASEEMKNTAYAEMERLLTAGDLATWRQWQALITGFGVSSRFIADAMSELTGKQVDVSELARGLHEGSISADDLLMSIEMLGQDWSKVPTDLVPQFVKDMNSALDVYKSTIEAWKSNIQFAVTRGGTNLLESLNEVMQTEQGLGIVDVLTSVRNTINDIFGAGSSLIQGHPEMLQTAFDIVGGFMERAKSFNWEMFSTNVVSNIGKLFDIIFSVYDSLPPGALEEFASFAIMLAGPLGSIFKTVQTGLPFVLGVFERFKDFDFNMLIGDITHQVDVFASAIERLLNVFTDEQLSKLLSIGLVWGTPLAKGFSTISRGLLELSGGIGGLVTAARGLRNADIWQNIRLWSIIQEGLNPGFLSTMATIGAGAGGLAALQLGLTTVAQKAQIAVEDESASILGLESLYAELETNHQEMAGISSIGENYGMQIAEAEVRMERAQELVRGIQSLHEELGRSPDSKDTIIRSMTSMMEELNGLYPSLNLGIDSVTGAYDANTSAIMRNISAYLELMDAQDRAAIAANVASEAQTGYLQAKGRERYWKARLADWEEQYGINYADLIASAGTEQTYEVDGMKIAYSAGDIKNPSLSNQMTKDSREALEHITEGMNEAHEAAEIAQATWQTATEDGENLLNVMDGLGELPQITEETIASTDTMSAVITALAEAYGDLREEAEKSLSKQIDLFGEVAEASETSFEDVKNNLEANREQIAQYRESIGFLEEYLYSGNLSPKTAEGMSREISELVNSGEYTAVIQMAQELQEAFDSGNYSSWIAENGPKFREVIDTMAESDSLAASIANIGLLGEAFGNVAAAQAAIAEYNGDSSEAIEEQGAAAEEATSPTQGFADAEQNVADSAASAKTNLDEAKTSIEQAAESAQNKSGAMSSFASAVDAVQASASAASDMVSSLASSINALQDKTITVGVNFNTVGGFMSGAGLGVPGTKQANGGWAGVGPVSFGPSGTDTIPTWLTPGEFVVTRKAAKMFGPTFLEKVNGMDIGGAFDALMRDMAHPAGLGYFPSITYNRDNHASVTINNNGETGQGYSQRKAYKWASKL